MADEQIHIEGAREHNLKNLSLAVPRRAITAFTGVSGSGKTSLVFDTIAAEAQRQLNETFTAFVRNRLPSYGRPDVDEISNLSPVVVINQRRLGGNARSTVGTITDVYALLRLLFSRAGRPWIGESNAFSFNDPAGMCPRCAGIGNVVTPDTETFLDTDRSMAGGAILLPGFGNKPGSKQYWYRQHADTGLFDTSTPLREWTADKRAELLHGLVEHFTRIYINTDDELSERKQAVLDRFTTSIECPECAGERLNERARGVRLVGHSITECTALEVTDLIDVLRGLDQPDTGPLVANLTGRLRALADIGLGYLTLDRATTSLSGGESQRIKMVRHLGSSLTEMLYVFDEPSIGLHPADIERLRGLLRRLRDKGNTILLVEHDPDVLAVADHVVDLGPAAGADGGQLVFQGSLAGLAASDTVSGRALRARSTARATPRTPTGHLAVTGADRHNLRGVHVEFPTGVLTAVTGVAGSGKSSLVGVLREQHPETTVVDQAALATNRRSNTATFSGIADSLRRMFAQTNGVPAALFSPNSAGACPDCRGLGIVHTDLAFLEDVVRVCETCRGRRFTDEVLRHTVHGHSIADVLDLSVQCAAEVLDERRIAPVLTALDEVGLGYLTLGQPLSTLSGGEIQRLKLASELRRRASNAVYVLDEPTTGLHLADVTRLLGILDRLVDAGNTIVVIEHNMDVVRRADWIVDLGPGAGRGGGRVLYSGQPDGLGTAAESVTAGYLDGAPHAALTEPARTAQTLTGQTLTGQTPCRSRAAAR